MGNPAVSAAIKNEYKTASVEGCATATISDVGKGAHSLYIYGETTFRNYSPLSANVDSTVYFVVDSVTPTIQVVSPRQATYSSITTPLEYKSDKPLTWVGYSLDQNMVVACPDKATLTNLSNGVNSLRIYGTDGAGKVYASEEVVFSVNGKEPPVVTIDAAAIVEARKFLPSDFQGETWWRLIFYVNEPTSWMGYSMDGGGNQTLEGNTTLRLSYGIHTIIVYAKDMCGNAGASTPYTFVLGKGEAGSAYASPTATQPLPEVTLQPSPSDTVAQQTQPDWFQMTFVVASTASVVIAVAGVFLVKRNRRRKDYV